MFFVVVVLFCSVIVFIIWFVYLFFSNSNAVMCFFSSLPLNKITELSVDNFEVKHLYTVQKSTNGKNPISKIYDQKLYDRKKKYIFQFAAK